MRQETLGRVRDITVVLLFMDTIEEFDEELFRMQVARGNKFGTGQIYASCRVEGFQNYLN